MRMRGGRRQKGDVLCPRFIWIPGCPSVPRLSAPATVWRTSARTTPIFPPIWWEPASAPPPLRRISRAAATVERTGLTGRIDLRLGDGLSPVRPEETDDIVIAGMGGETIAAILAAALWTRDGRYRLILQPMSRPEELRRFLLRSGFAIESERIARDGDRLYTVLCAAFSPASAAEQLARPACFYRGGVDAADPDGRAYLFHQAKRLEAAAIALQGAGQADKAESLLKVAGQLTAGLPSKY